MLPIPSRIVLLHTERWFVRRGVPTMIREYGFRAHVLPRMLPFLALVSAGSLLWLARDAAAPATRWTVLGVILAIALAAWGALTAFGRKLPHFSRGATAVILTGYGLMPLVVPLLEFDRETVAVSVAGFVVIFGAVFIVAWLFTTYGALPLLRRATKHAVLDMGNSVRLQGRALPMLLFVTLFFFFTGELWQATDRLPWWRVGMVIALFAAVTVLAAAGRLRDEIGRVEHDLSAERLTAACRNTPLAGIRIDRIAVDGALKPAPLTRAQLGNLLLMLATRQLVQAAVVGAGLFGFFLLLGLIVVRPETAEQWIGGPVHYSPILDTVPVALLRNAALLAAFGSMYFAVTSMSDVEHRRQFFAPIIDDVERILAIRAVYLALRLVPDPPLTRSLDHPAG